jgi:hypothetical protein
LKSSSTEASRVQAHTITDLSLLSFYIQQTTLLCTLKEMLQTLHLTSITIKELEGCLVIILMTSTAP